MEEQTDISVVTYEIGNKTDIGKVRQQNQDYFGKYSGSYGDLLIVCDGMGGYFGGELAAQIAVESISAHFAGLEAEFDPTQALNQSLISAQTKIEDYKAEHPEVADMGTTAVVVLLREQQFWYAWVGDSRIYLVRDDKIQQLSRDHSYVQDLVDEGLIEASEMATHPKRNIITRALGTGNFDAEVRGPFSLEHDDRILMCSDGLHPYFTDEELLHYLRLEPQEACNQLVEVANARGGADNITLQIVKANHGEGSHTALIAKKYNAITLGLMALSVLLFTIVMIAGIVLYSQSLSTRERLALSAKNKHVADSLKTAREEEEIFKTEEAEAQKERAIEDAQAKRRELQRQKDATEKARIADSLKAAGGSGPAPN